MTPLDRAKDILTHCVAGRTHQIARIVSARYDSALEAHGLTSHQLTLLSMICMMQPVAPASMLPYLKMDQSTLSRNLDRLVNKGWLEAVADDNDRRFRLLKLTDAGSGVLEVGHASWQEAQTWAYSAFSDEGVEALKNMAHRLNPLLPNDGASD